MIGMFSRKPSKSQKEFEAFQQKFEAQMADNYAFIAECEKQNARHRAENEEILAELKQYGIEVD